MSLSMILQYMHTILNDKIKVTIDIRKRADF